MSELEPKPYTLSAEPSKNQLLNSSEAMPLLINYSLEELHTLTKVLIPS